MDGNFIEDFFLKITESSKTQNVFGNYCKDMCLEEINKPDWWSSVQVLEQNLTPGGKEFMYIMRLLVYKCCQYFKKPSKIVNLEDHIQNMMTSHIFNKRKHEVEEDYSKMKRKTLLPEHISIGTNLPIDKENTVYIYPTTPINYNNTTDQETEEQYNFLSGFDLKTTYDNKKNNVPSSKSVKFKLASSIPFSSNLGQILMKRDNHNFPENLKKLRLERVERYINQPCRNSLSTKYAVTYQKRKFTHTNSHWYKFSHKEIAPQYILNENKAAMLCKPLTVKLIREDLKILKEKVKIEQKRKLQILVPKLSVSDLLTSNITHK